MSQPRRPVALPALEFHFQPFLADLDDEQTGLVFIAAKERGRNNLPD